MCRVLLRCDSTRDLYPVTAPSPISHTFLVSQHTWHQRLGHLGSEVLHRLVSSNLISCNKDKHPVHCHACHLGKHVRLPFVSSNTVKFHADGTLSRYKARLVANDSTQLEGVDVDETFSLVVKPGTIQTVLRFWDSVHTDYVCLLQRSLYGLKQASRAWFQRFSSYITRVGFHYSRCDSSLFTYGQGTDTAYLLLYVDDIVLTASSETLLQQVIGWLHQEFSMTDLGSLNYFLGISVTRDSSGMFLSQKKYVVEIFERAGMVNCNPSRTPVDTESKLGDTDLVAYSDADWAGCPTTRRSTFGYCVFLGNNLLSWSSKRQPTLSRSSAEAEYRGVANAVAETCWIRNLLRELHSPLCLFIVITQVRVLHVPSRYQFADIFTKGLPLALFEEF
ncbi:ribonuclease H-like domain-containing protein [Tanacetum coccineum]|uniref:Ribonuclease H-like domain-containing protein n=1 Tax=Tanacetum coccineum TaxID=301880 RepID=A0ABQ4YLY4_9ASTR